MNSCLDFLKRELGDRNFYRDPSRLLPGFMREREPLVALVVLGVPVAIELIRFGIVHRREIKASCEHLKNKIVRLYVYQPGKDKSEEKKRIRKNILLTAVAVVAVAAAIVTIYALIKFGILSAIAAKTYVFLKNISAIQSIVKRLQGIDAWHPFPENPPIVYAGYIGIGLINLKQAYSSFKESKPRAAMHSIAAATTATALFLMATGRYEARWHHLSYGLLAMGAPFRAVNVFGSLMAADSLLYFFKPSRDNFDFSNIFVNHLGAYLAQMALLSLIQYASQQLEKRRLANEISESEKVEEKNQAILA